MTIPRQRYTSVAIFLHWIMAVCFLLMLTSGVVMNYVDIGKSLKFQMFQWHKSLGVLLLMAFFLRIVWRLLHRPPRLSDHMSRFEELAAKTGHWLLYVFMLAMPFSGWLLVSSSSYGLPTIVFGLFEWPHVPGVAGNDQVQQAAGNAHFYFAIIFATLIVGHIAAVIKHAIFDHENLLPRMWWTKERPDA